MPFKNTGVWTRILPLPFLLARHKLIITAEDYMPAATSKSPSPITFIQQSCFIFPQKEVNGLDLYAETPDIWRINWLIEGDQGLHQEMLHRWCWALWRCNWRDVSCMSVQRGLNPLQSLLQRCIRYCMFLHLRVFQLMVSWGGCWGSVGEHLLDVKNAPSFDLWCF